MKDEDEICVQYQFDRHHNCDFAYTDGKDRWHQSSLPWSAAAAAEQYIMIHNHMIIQRTGAGAEPPKPTKTMSDSDRSGIAMVQDELMLCTYCTRQFFREVRMLVLVYLASLLATSCIYEWCAWWIFWLFDIPRHPSIIFPPFLSPKIPKSSCVVCVLGGSREGRGQQEGAGPRKNCITTKPPHLASVSCKEQMQQTNAIIGA